MRRKERRGERKDENGGERGREGFTTAAAWQCTDSPSSSLCLCAARAFDMGVCRRLCAHAHRQIEDEGGREGGRMLTHTAGLHFHFHNVSSPSVE